MTLNQALLLLLFTLGDCLFGAVKLTKNADPYEYSDYGISFDACTQFSLLTGEWGKNVVIYGVKYSL